MGKPSTFLKTPLYRKIWRKTFRFLQAGFRKIAPNTLDTITTRFLILFLFLLSIPMGSLIIFSDAILANALHSSGEKLLNSQAKLFEAELESNNLRLKRWAEKDLPRAETNCVNGELSFCLNWSAAQKQVKWIYAKESVFMQNRTFTHLHNEIAEQLNHLPAEQPGFLVWNEQLYQIIKTQQVHHKTTTQRVYGFAIDQEFLNHFLKKYPDLEIGIIISGPNLSIPRRHKALTVWSSLNLDASSLASLTGQSDTLTEAGWRPSPNPLNDSIDLAFSRPVTNSRGETLAKIIFALPKASQNKQFNWYESGICLIALGSLIFSALLAMLASRTITLPLLNLVRQVNELSKQQVLKKTEPLQVQGVFEITQLGHAFNRMMTKLQAEQKLKDDFVAALTHDLKVPLLAKKQIINYLLQESYGPIQEEQAEILKTLYSTNQDCLSLVTSLLEIYRYSSGQVHLIWETFSITKLMRQTIEELRPLAQEKSIVIDAEYLIEDDEQSAHVYADAMEVKRVLHNLISNAIINTPTHGTIQCKIAGETQFKNSAIYKLSSFRHTTLKYAVKLQEKLIITIQDSGIGFSKEDLAGLFRQFNTSKSRNPLSIGLGLHNCYQVIQAHHNILWVESTEGEGTAVNFTLGTNPSIAQERRIFSDRRKGH